MFLRSCLLYLISQYCVLKSTIWTLILMTLAALCPLSLLEQNWNCIAFNMSGSTQAVSIDTSKGFYLPDLEPLVSTSRHSSHHGFHQQCWKKKKKPKSMRNLQRMLFRRTTHRQRKWFLEQCYHQIGTGVLHQAFFQPLFYNR